VASFAAVIRRVWTHPGVKWVLLAFVIFLLVLEALGLKLFRGSLDTSKVGTLGAWLSALATLVAVSLALLDSARLRRDARRTELRDLAAWMEPVRSQDGQRGWQLVVRNGTKYPISHWFASPNGEHADWHACSIKHGALLPDSNLFDVSADTAATRISLVDLHFVDREHKAWRINGLGTLTSSTAIQNHATDCELLQRRDVR
jgi:hypothetical protein